MGAQYSQSQKVDFEEVTKKRTLQPWLKVEGLFANEKCRGTCNISKCLPIIQEILLEFQHSLVILEVGSGNGFNSSLISTLKNIKCLTATDMLVYQPSFYKTNKALSHHAVQEHKADIDVLLLVSPPPNQNFMDYYAIKEYELKPQKKVKHLMILGELGAGDGSTGIYFYLFNQSKWQCLQQTPFNKEILFGEECVRSVYFFKFVTQEDSNVPEEKT